jgi:hypothetical protein
MHVCIQTHTYCTYMKASARMRTCQYMCFRKVNDNGREAMTLVMESAPQHEHIHQDSVTVLWTHSKMHKSCNHIIEVLARRMQVGSKTTQLCKASLPRIFWKASVSQFLSNSHESLPADVGCVSEIASCNPRLFDSTRNSPSERVYTISYRD